MIYLLLPSTLAMMFSFAYVHASDSPRWSLVGLGIACFAVSIAILLTTKTEVTLKILGTH